MTHLEEVLDGLDVVVRDRLGRLDLLRVGDREVAVDVAQRVELRRRDRRELRHEAAELDKVPYYITSCTTRCCGCYVSCVKRRDARTVLWRVT